MVENEDVVLKIDDSTCVRCGLCVSSYPDVFKFADNGDITVEKKVGRNLLSEVTGICPVGAISEKKD